MDDRIIDLIGLLDDCGQCGAKYNSFRRALRGKDYEYWCECSECGNAINIQDSKTNAMITWNKDQRRKHDKV